MQIIPWAVFSGLRGYVLSKSQFLGVLILVLSLAPGTNLAMYAYDMSGEEFPHIGCLATNNTTEAGNMRFAVFNLGTLKLVTEIILRSSPDVLRDIWQSKRLSLPDILLHDGIIYFIVLCFLNVALSVASLANDSPGTSYLTIFTPPLTSILVSRFLLRLQEASQTIVRVNSDDPLYSSTDLYDEAPSFIRSLGAIHHPDHTLLRDANSESH
ncbi:hypothetical protein OH76DRAFT_560811 [Lentinus brumalis]|uniref:Uncharacterized protein n=1 Tax=Lentinus brumalis TaxID=2498619 RepID=A0A371D9H3_9APHY|nr:hypothetical protein OH76DRAFT_560811 [Polyporus brumalis]